MFDDAVRGLLDSQAFATLATLMPDGAPQNSVMWFRREGDTLLMVAPAASRKARNLERDPRGAVVVEERENPYHYAEIRGRAEVRHDDAGARQELRRIAARYIGDRADAFTDALSADPRVLIVIHPTHVRHHAATRPG